MERIMNRILFKNGAEFTIPFHDDYMLAIVNAIKEGDDILYFYNDDEVYGVLKVQEILAVW